MDITKTLSISNLLARRAELAATAEHKAETEIIDAMNTAMLDYADNQSTNNSKALEHAFDKLSKLVFKKALDRGAASRVYPLDEILADGRKVREICADTIAVIDNVKNIKDEIAFCQHGINSDNQRLEQIHEKYIFEIENSLTVQNAALKKKQEELVAAEKALDDLKNHYGVK